MPPPQPAKEDHLRTARRRRCGHGRVGFFMCLAAAAILISVTTLSTSVTAQGNAPHVMPINPCQFGLPPPTGFRCENGVMVADVTSAVPTAISSASSLAPPLSSAATASATNPPIVPVPDSQTTTSVSAPVVPNTAAAPVSVVQGGPGTVSNTLAVAGPNPVAGAPVPIVNVGPSGPVAQPVPGAPVPIAPAAATPSAGLVPGSVAASSVGNGVSAASPVVTSAVSAVPVPVVTNAFPIPFFNNPAASVPVATTAAPVPVVNTAAPVPASSDASAAPRATSEPAVLVPIVSPTAIQAGSASAPTTAIASTLSAAAVPIAPSSSAVAPGSAEPLPSPTNPAAPPIINPLFPIIAPFFNSPAYTQKVQQNLPGATPSPPAPSPPVLSPPAPPQQLPPNRGHINDLDLPDNSVPNLIVPGSGFLIPVASTPTRGRDDTVFGRIPLSPGHVDQQGLVLSPQNVVRTTHLAPVQGIQGAVNIPVAMSRGAQVMAQVEDNEQLDLTVRELKARYLRQLRRQGLGSPVVGGSMRVSRHMRQQTSRRHRAKGVQVRQGRHANVGRVLQHLARRFKGRGSVDVRQLARRFRGNPELRVLARRVKGRRVNLGALARWFRQRRAKRGQVGWARRRRRQMAHVMRRPLSLRALAQQFPRASLDQIARRFPQNRGLRKLVNRFKGRKVGIRQLTRLLARRARQARKRSGGVTRGQKRTRPSGRRVNLQALARRFPRWNLEQVTRRFPRHQGLHNLAKRLKGGRKVNLQSLVQRIKQRSMNGGRKGGRRSVQSNRRGRSNRGGLMTLFRRLQKQRGAPANANLQRLAWRLRNNPRFRGMLRKARGNPKMLQRFVQRLGQRRLRRGRGRAQGLVGLKNLARRLRGNRRIQALARRFPRGRINLAQLARRFPRNRKLQQLARQLRSPRPLQRNRSEAQRMVTSRRRQGPIGRSLINYADAWFKDIHRFNKQQQARLQSGPVYNAHVVPVMGPESERGLGELAELADARGWLRPTGKRRRGARKQGIEQQQEPSFFGERRARGSRMVGSDPLVRQGDRDAGANRQRAFSVSGDDDRDLSEPPTDRESVLPEGVLDTQRWLQSGQSLQEAMKKAAETFGDDLREPKGPPKSPRSDVDGNDDASRRSVVNRRRLGGEQSSRTRRPTGLVPQPFPRRPVNVEYGNDAYQCQCDQAALRRARQERQSQATKFSSKVFRVKLKHHPGLIPCRCVRRGSIGAVRSLRNVAKQLCPARVVPSRAFVRDLSAFSLPRVPAQAGLSLRPFGKGHPVAVLQRKASIKEDQLDKLPATRAHRFGFQSKSGIPLESRIIMARLRLRVQGKDQLPGVCTVKDAAMAVKVGGKLVASRMFPDGTLPANQVLTLIGRVPEAGQALGQGRKVTIEAIVRYYEKECLDMTRFEVVHTAMCADKPRAGVKEGLEEA